MSLRVQMLGAVRGAAGSLERGILLREAAEGEWYKGSRDEMSRLFCCLK